MIGEGMSSPVLAKEYSRGAGIKGESMEAVSPADRTVAKPPPLMIYADAATQPPQSSCEELNNHAVDQVGI